VFEGWSASGKGSTINMLTERLEPRGFRLHVIRPPRTSEARMPWLWRFWLRTPNYGEMAIFDQSWYRRVLVKRVEKLVPKEHWKRSYEDITDFERALADDGYVIIKLFLHIDKEEQARRFLKLEKDPLGDLLLEREDWQQHRNYKKYFMAIEEMLERTESEWAPWTIVEATDRYWTRVKVIETLIRRFEDALVKRGHALPPVEIAAPAPEETAEEPQAKVSAAPESEKKTKRQRHKQRAKQDRKGGRKHARKA
jgi:polyphosphate kinase 2 (PPK2 family)